MAKNMKIDKAAKKDIWAESVLKAKSVPEANYKHVDTFEKNKKKAHEFGKPFKTVYNENPSPDKYMKDHSKSTLNKDSHPRIGIEVRPHIWAAEIKHAAETPVGYEHKDTFAKNSKKAAMIGLPRKEEKNNNPAPGQYEPIIGNSFSRCSNTKSPGKWNNDKRKDPFAEHVARGKEAPAELYAQNQGTMNASIDKSFTIGKGFTTKYNENPGPGQYKVQESPARGLRPSNAERDTMEFFRSSF